MKIFKVVMLLSVFYSFGISASIYAEIIYTKEKQIIHAVIIEKTDDTIWYEVKSGDMTEEIGIDISDIDNVLNDDGSVSKYSPKYRAY